MVAPRPGRAGKRAENQAEERGEFGKFPSLPPPHFPAPPPRPLPASSFPESPVLALKVGLKCINIKKSAVDLYLEETHFQCLDCM